MIAFLKDWWAFLRSSKKYWLVPILLILLLLGSLIVLAPTAVAPFIYALF